MKKRFFALVTAVVIIFNIFSFSAFAQSDNDWVYEILSQEEKTAQIVDYIGNATELYFPEELDGYTMVAIADGFFNNSPFNHSMEYEQSIYIQSITKAVIPDTYKRIGENVLIGLDSMKELVLPEGLEFIGMNSLHGSEYMQDIMVTLYTEDLPKVYYYDNYCIVAEQNQPMPKTYEIASETTLIASGAFLNIRNVSKIIIPDSVRYINSAAFCSCRELEHIVIPNSVTRLEKWTFVGCERLRVIEIPESVTYIDDELVAELGSNVYYGITIYGVAGSQAELFAIEKGMDFVDMSKALYGDVDGDDEITANDYAVLKSYMLNEDVLEGEQEYLADTNHDQAVDGFDILNVNRIMNGLD